MTGKEDGVADNEEWTRDRDRFVRDAQDAAALRREPLPDLGRRLGPLAMEFARLTYSLLDAVTVADVLEQVVTTAEQVVANAQLVSVTQVWPCATRPENCAPPSRPIPSATRSTSSNTGSG